MSDLVELFTTVPGMETAVGQYGIATNTRSVRVPKSEVKALIAEGTLGTKPLEPTPVKKASASAKREK